MTGATAFQKATTGGGINQSARQVFLSLYPNRHQGILKPSGCKSWVTLSKHAPVSDDTLLNAVGLADQAVWGCRWGATTRFAVLDIDKNSQYHNELGLARLRHSLTSIGFDAPKLYQSSDSQGWHLYLFFSDWVCSDTLQKQLRQWLVAENYTVKQGQLEVFPSNNGLRLPMQRGFAWLDDQSTVISRREDKTTDQAITSFLDDLDAGAHSWEVLQRRIDSRLNELTRAAEVVQTNRSEVSKEFEDDGFSAFFTKAGMISEVYSFGQSYWVTGLTAPSQRHHAMLCLGHYLWYGDEQAGVRALPGVGRADERAAVIEAWLREHHNGYSQAVIRGDWNEISNDIRRACNWTASEGSEKPQESYQLTDRAIDRLIGLTKQTGRVWSSADFKKGNIKREETARQKIQTALMQLVDTGRRVTLRGLMRLSGCDHKTINRHVDIWGVFRLPRVGGDLSFAVAQLGGSSQSPAACSQETDFDRFDQLESKAFSEFDLGSGVLGSVELPGNTLRVDFSMELDSLRFSLSGATANNSTATPPESFPPLLPVSLAPGSSSSAGFAGLWLKAGGFVCSLNGTIPSFAEPLLGPFHLPQTNIFPIGSSGRQSNRNCSKRGNGGSLKPEGEQLYQLRPRAP